MATLMLHRQILKNFSKLPVKVQKRVSEFIEKFQEDPNAPSLHVHSLKESMIDPKVRGANLPDGYRAIIIAPDKGDTYLLVHINTHDEAYFWAKNKRFDVNESTGVFQVFDIEEIQNAISDIQKETISNKNNLDYPLKKLSDDELFNLGVPKPLIPSVREIDNDISLEHLLDYLPPDCRDTLSGISAGMSVDETLEEMLGLTKEQEEKHQPEGSGDFTKISDSPNYDLVIIEGEEHFKEILSASLDEWRIFLHPYQKKMVEWKTNGPMNINGSAGTGKTVALIHRAVTLSKNLDDIKSSILLTTYTTNLSITIKHQIRQLSPKTADKIQVTNLHALARTICNRTGFHGRIIAEDEISDIWDEVWNDPTLDELPMKKNELIDEYYLVIEPNGIESEDEYLTTIRSGRPRISRQQRRDSWPIFKLFQRALKKRQLLTFEGAIHQARLAVENGNFPKFRHVLVDEIQDFSLEALRLIRSLSPIENNLSDPLCTVGDGHQRIYRKKVPHSRAGINIRGRSRRLKINYRTSEQIRKYAYGILKGMDIDDLDEGVAITTGDHSVFKGPDPIIEQCETIKEEADNIIAWIQTLIESHNLEAHEICITPYKELIREKINASGILTYELKPREEDPGSDEPGIRLGSMKRIKGLEFRAIAMACADENDPINFLYEAENLDRCERYVAATRAREHLLITTCDKK